MWDPERPRNNGLETTVRRVSVDKVRALRHVVLRPGKPLESAQWEGDDSPHTWHCAVFGVDRGGEEVGSARCCVSYFAIRYQHEPAWQLRGMATDPLFQGYGLGQYLLGWAERNIVSTSEVKLFWCHARTDAVEFYEKQGWKTVSDEYIIPDVGPHYMMVRRVE